MTYSSYQVKTTTWINLYRYLGIYAKKDSSAWTEVWSGARPSTAPITAPGGRDLGDFRASGQAGDIYISSYQVIYMQRRILALGPRFGQVLGPQQRLLRLPEVAIWEIFELLGRLVTYI